MKKLSLISKTILALTLTSGSIWIGAYSVKLFLVYNLFETKDLILKTSFNIETADKVIISFLPVFATVFISYILMIFFLILFIATAKLKLRSNGWFFMSLILIFFTFPFEVYLMIIDYKIIIMMMSSSISAEYALSLLKDRITVLSSFPLVQLFSYITIIFLIVFKPLTIKESGDEN